MKTQTEESQHLSKERGLRIGMAVDLLSQSAKETELDFFKKHIGNMLQVLIYHGRIPANTNKEEFLESMIQDNPNDPKELLKEYIKIQKRFAIT